MTDASTEGGLTRVTVNRTPRGAAALLQIRGGGSQTDAINRSLQLASLMKDLADPTTGRITLIDRDGERVHVYLVG